MDATKRVIQILFIFIVLVLGYLIVATIVNPEGNEKEKKIDNWEEYWASKKDNVSNDGTKVDLEVSEEPITVEKRQIQYTKSMIRSDGINSYWFVIVIPKDKAGTKHNSWIKQNHSYFSPTEAMKSFGDKEYFIYYFTEISEATFIDACSDE